VLIFCHRIPVSNVWIPDKDNGNDENRHEDDLLGGGGSVRVRVKSDARMMLLGLITSRHGDSS
jgi:hypothetical protein